MGYEEKAKRDYSVAFILTEYDDPLITFDPAYEAGYYRVSKIAKTLTEGAP